jgi:hypothetical protein
MLLYENAFIVMSFTTNCEIIFRQNYPYLLHGEIDKRGQPLFIDALGYYPNPDFVLHIPGSLDNLLVIEVKSTRCTVQEAQDDLTKLTDMINHPQIHYQHGIFLVFGPDNQRQQLRNIVIENQHITYFWHHNPRASPELLVRGDWNI